MPVPVIEFEVKARVPEGLLSRLREALGPARAVETHKDAYYAHPCRDFGQTDEALRVSLRGGALSLTYKGPRLDPGSKARREITVPLPADAPVEDLLGLLGFREVLAVEKQRQTHHVAGFEVALDAVPGLGTFLELERVVPPEADRRALEAEARELLASWGIKETERRSYLELLLEARSP